jgi:transposase-like protein
MPNASSPFTPPFCPNPHCNSRTSSQPWRYKKKGFFDRDVRPRRIQRYLCQHCYRNFSSQTFATDYWLRRGDLLEAIFHRLVSCSGLRQISRETGVSHTTVRRLADRLGRHCLLFHEENRPKDTPAEPLVLDGFRTFEHSQYWPMDINLLIGTSHFVYGFNDAELRRSGTMRPAQRVKRLILEKKYGRPDPQATRKQVEELLRRVVRPGGAVVLRSDEHPSYPRAMQGLSDRSFHHQATSSKDARTTTNPLFPVNLADMLLRHSSSNHKRETIAFSKRRQGAMYRVAIWAVWRNYIKDRSENRRVGTPAMALGLRRRAMTVHEVLSERLLPTQIGISGWISRCYFGRIATRAIERCRSHRAVYAM